MKGIQFTKDLAPLILSGTKTATTRNSKHEPGEMFSILDPETRHYRLYHIIKAERTTLNTVAQKHYKEEGLSSPLEFIGLWSKLYPGEGWQPAKRVWFHTFEEVRG